MRCPQCGSLNPDTALQCTDCGAVLASGGSTASTMDQVDIQNDLAVARDAISRLRRYVPAAVAEGILHDEEQLRGERREVAVLFADAVNFTHLASSLDAESVFDLINDLLSRLLECIHRYGGTVDKFTGDGLMAVFGAPIAHESNSELAVRAALDIQKAAVAFEPIALAQLGAPLKIRIGIHTGLVVAGILGTKEQAAYTVIGTTVNLASRVESLARPGQVLVSSYVYQQTRALFDFQAMGMAQVKGIAEPVATYQVIGDRSEPLPVRGVAGVTDVFLGRDAELEQLRALVVAFLNDRYGRLVEIQGEAGMGKSRLVSEMLSAVMSEQVTIWQGRALPYTQGVGYGIFRSLLQDAVRARPSPRIGSLDEAWEAHVSPALRPFLRQVLGLALTPEEQAIMHRLEPERVKQLTIVALREWLLNQARQRPAILILDDFHWADDLSRDMLRALVNLVYEAPVFLCVVTRPQPEAPLDLPVPPVDESLIAPLHLSLELKPLSPEHSRALLAHLVSLDNMPEALIDTILTRAEGNPFYIEEFVHMLIEKEVLALEDGQWQVISEVALQRLEVPTTLRGLMMARVDRLPQDLQDVLRSAAVIGMQFSARLLEEVEHRLRGPIRVTPLLERLKDLGLLVERAEAGEEAYAFRHIVTQETVYHSLLRSQRPELHRTVAGCIESLYAADLSSQVEALALHYHRARVRDRAMYYALLAGSRARERFANREAIEYYSRALQLSQHLSNCAADRWQAAVGLGQVEQHIGEYEEADACYQAALEEWKGALPEARAQVMLRLGQVWEKRGDMQEAEGWLHQGLDQLKDISVPLPELCARFYSELGWLSLRRGALTAAQEWLEQGLVLVSDSEHYDVLSSIFNRLGLVYYGRSEWDRAATCVESALELRERLGDLVSYARSLNNLGILKWTSGSWDGALADFERAAEMHERIGEVEGLALACTNLGVLYTDRGEWAKAEENLCHSFVIAQRMAHPYQLALAHMNLGCLYLLQERWADCARHLDAAIPLYTEAGASANLTLSDAYWLQGRLHLEQGQTGVAQQWAERCHDLLQQITDADRGESVEWGQYERLMGCIAQARGDLAAARCHLEHSAAIFHASGSQIESGRTAYLSGLLSLKLGQPERACEELLTAQKIFKQLGAAADLRRVEEQLSRLEEE